VVCAQVSNSPPSSSTSSNTSSLIHSSIPLLLQMNPSHSKPEISDMKPIMKKNKSRKRGSSTSIPTTISSEMSPQLASCQVQTSEKIAIVEVEIVKPLPRKRTLKDFLPKYVQIVMLLVCIAVFFSIKMMPSKYMVSPFSSR
jgi:hypothetical protein